MQCVPGGGPANSHPVVLRPAILPASTIGSKLIDSVGGDQKAAFGIIVVAVVVAVAGSIPTRAQPKGVSKTWTGIISDSNCKDKPH